MQSKTVKLELTIAMLVITLICFAAYKAKYFPQWKNSVSYCFDPPHLITSPKLHSDSGFNKV